MINEPEVLDEKHPLLAPTIEKLAQRRFPTPDLVRVIDRIALLHESVIVRKDSSLPLGPSNRLHTTCLALTAPTFHGKTYSMDAAIDGLVPVVVGDAQVVQKKVLRYKCTPNASVGAFLNGLLRHAGYPANRDLPPGVAASRIAAHFQQEQFTLLAIDEFQWAINPAASPGRSREQDENLVWNTLHSIIDNVEWSTPTVVNGLLSIVDSLNHNTAERAAIRSRFDIMSMASMTIGNAKDAKDIVDLYCKDAGVTFAIHPDFALGKRLTHASNYTLGIVLRLARLAIARAALRPDRTLTTDDFVDAYATKTGCRLQANPFHADDWPQIDPTLLMAQTADQRRAEKAEQIDKPRRSRK